MPTNFPFSMAISRCLLLLLFISLFASFGSAEIRFAGILLDERPIILFNEFGFTHTGRLQLNVSDIRLSYPNPDLDLAKVGFFLCTRDALLHVLQQLEYGEVVCALNSDYVKVVSTFRSMRNGSFDYLYQETNADQYKLVFTNCLNQVKVSMNVRSAMYNLDGEKNTRDYLSAGEAIIPRVYFLLSLVYFTLAGIWLYVLYKKPLSVFRIHFLMLAVVILKAFNLVCEAVDKSYIKRTGSYAPRWNVLFGIFSFLKGITLFPLIVLIGTGWSFFEPDLYTEDKWILMIAIVFSLQLGFCMIWVALDLIVGFPRQDVSTWKQVCLLFVDGVCCCAVFSSIVGSIEKLREAARTDTKAAVYLMKLTLFRHYYVFLYIYIARIMVYVLERTTSYKYLWTSVVVGELATLTFFAFTGYTFKPEAHNNPYFVINGEEERL